MTYFKRYKNIFSIKYLLVIVIIALLCYTYLYTNSMYDSQSDNLGYKRVSSFMTEIELTIQSYNIAVEKERKSLIKNTDDNCSKDDIVNWLSEFNTEAATQLKLDNISSFFILNGRIYTDNFNTNNIISNEKIHTWSESIIKNKSKTTGFSPLFSFNNEYYFIIYRSFALNDNIVIMASLLPVDKLKQIWFDEDINDIEQIYILADKNLGLSFTTYDTQSIYMFLEPINNLINIIKHQNEISGVITQDFSNGSIYNTYFINRFENSFIAAVVIPKEYIKYSVFKNVEVYIYVILFFVAVMILLFINDIKNNLKAKRSHEFIKIIGSSYYAIFSINIKTDKFDIVKANSEVNKYVSKSGVYSYLHKLLCTVVEKGTQGDFANSFSLENIRELAKQGKVDFGGDFQRILENGYIWVQIRLLYNKDVNPDYAVLAFRERNDEKKKELERVELLETSIAAMKKSNIEKNTFYSALSHDMRTPLNAIIGLSELLEQDINNKDKVNDYVEKIKLSGQQLLSLIDNFLDYTKKTYNSEENKDNDIIDFQLKEYLDSILSIYNIVAQKEKKVFKVSYDITHNSLNGDTTKLYRIINNIVSNSFKYTKQGDKISLKVTEIKNQGRPKYKFEFTDTGIGMDDDFIQQIYSPYKREKRFETKETAGVGLGMAIVENYVRYLNGEIFIESKRNEGTKVTITLAFDISNAESSSENMQHHENKDVTGLNVLIAEDNDINMFIVSELLTRNGHHVFKAYNGQEALDLFVNNPENKFDVILMDINMPVLDGLETAKKIRGLNRNDAKLIPIIALSANVYTEDVAASNKAGMNAHLAKPVNYSMIQEVFNSLLKRDM